jgi:uncharacterized protein Yka (UPF0111/DUF47 family)
VCEKDGIEDMVSKIGIVESLGEGAILLPGLIDAALTANDRLKIRLTLLQEAASHAAEPGRPPLSLEAECRAVGLTEPDYAGIVAGARAHDAESFVAPGAERLAAGFVSDLAAMAAPVEVAHPNEAAGFTKRREALLACLPGFADDRVAYAQVGALAVARRGEADSLHLLVMDLHKAINRVAAETAPEQIDGARAAGLDEPGRQRVRAFMRGLNHTAGLAFGHPGLGTTAGRVGARLTIQNDIGATDAHVLVVHVEGKKLTVTYTDVHRARAKFFIALFDGQNARWSPLAEKQQRDLAEGEIFYLITGTLDARDDAELDAFLEFLGSRIVFLIDWNKARKALQTFVAKGAAIEILTGAARNDEGHRAFLELGGADLVFEAVRRAAPGRIGYGQRLDQALGEAECLAFLKNVLRAASQGLLAGRSARLIRDEIQADLSQRLDTAESEVLGVVARHLGLTRMLAGMIETAFPPNGLASLPERQALTARAKKIEQKGDRLTVAAREAFERVRDADELLLLIDSVEDATDTFDEAAFLISLAPDNSSADALSAPLAGLAAIATECAGSLVRAIEAARLIPEGKRLDAAFALQCVDAVLTAERAADEAERAAIGAIMGAGPDMARPDSAEARCLVLGLEIARTLEGATDRLAHAALSLRNRVLQELSA